MPLPCETSITCAWAVATDRRPLAGLTPFVYMDVYASGSRSLRVLLHSLLPTDDACSSSSLSSYDRHQIFHRYHNESDFICYFERFCMFSKGVSWG